jgi:hypothetical protein
LARDLADLILKNRGKEIERVVIGSAMEGTYSIIEKGH